MKTNKKILSVILLMLLIFSLASIVIPVTQAGIVTIYTKGVSNNSGGNINAIYPSSDSYLSGVATCFTPTQTAYLTSISINFQFSATTTVNTTCRIKGVQDSIASDTATPNATTYISSDNVQTINSGASSAYMDITWTFDGSYLLESGKEYAVAVELTYINVAKSTKYINPNMYTTDQSTDTPSLYHNGGWIVDYPTKCLNIDVYGDTNQQVTPTPTPTAPPSIPDNYLSATFGISPYPDAGMIDWWTGSTSDETLTQSYTGHNGTYQLMNGTKVSARALPDHDYVFDHWEATTGEYVFTPTVNPISFTGTNNFNLTAVCVLASEADTVYIQLPHTTGGRINVIYSTVDGFYQEYTNQNFYAKTGSNLTLQGIYETGYVYYGMEIIPETEGVYVAQTITATSRDIQALYNCTIRGIFALGSGATNPPVSDGSDHLTPMLTNISIFLLGDNSGLSAGFGLIIMLAICILLLMIAGKSIEVLMLGVIIATIVNVSVGIWELWTIILVIIAIVAVALKNSGVLSSNGE